MLKIEAKHVSTKEQKTQTNITFSTKEPLSEIDRMAIDGGNGLLIFSRDFKKDGIEEAIRDVDLGVEYGKHSPSKKLRGKLYDYWYENIKDESWEDWYVKKMDGVLEFMTKQLQ